MIIRLTRRAAIAWQSWRMRRALYRAAPKMRELHSELRDRRRRHRATRDVEAALREQMTTRLRSEVGL